MNIAKIFYTILIISITSCKEKHGETFTVDGEILEFTEFGEGSYWVYQNTFNDEIDTVTLINNEMIVLHGHDGNKDKFVNLRNEFKHSSLHYESVEKHFESAGPDQSNPIPDRVLLSFLPVEFFSGHDHIFIEDIEEGVTIDSGTSTYSNTGFEDISFDGGTINCLKVSIKRVSSMFSYTSINWAKNIGKVKYTLADGSEWELVKFVPAK